jgi:uncharacterized coiled-coil protein SlyX
MHRFFSVLFGVLFFFGFVSALTIDAPSSVPENVSFGFKVVLDSTEKWTKTTIKVDEANLLDVYSSGTVVPDPQNGQFASRAFVIDTDPSSTAGLLLFVSYLGFSKGKHVISASSESGSDSKEIVSFVPIDESYKESVESTISELDGKISKQVEKLDDLEGKLGGIQKSLNQAGQKVESLNDKLENNIENRVGNLEEKVDSLNAKPVVSNPVSGLINLVDSLFVPLGIVALIIILAGLIMLFKSRFGGGGSAYYKDEFGLPASKKHEEMASDLTEK